MWDDKTYWTYAQISLLWEFSKQGLPMQDIIMRTGKSGEAILKKAAELGINVAELPQES